MPRPRARPTPPPATSRTRSRGCPSPTACRSTTRRPTASARRRSASTCGGLPAQVDALDRAGAAAGREPRMPDPEPLDVDEAVDALNDALSLQYRSALAYTVLAGSLTGWEFQPLT